MSRIVLGGNIGETQGLASLDRAMHIWITGHSNRPVNRIELITPVDRWLFDSFRPAFYDHQTEYPTWRTVFDYDPRPDEKVTTSMLSKDVQYYKRFESVPRTQSESLISAERQYVREIVKRAEDDGDSSGITDALGNYISGRPDVARWVFTTLVTTPDISKDIYIHPPRWREALDYAASQSHEPWKTQYVGLLATMQMLARYFLELGDPGKEASSSTATIFSTHGFPSTARIFSGLATGAVQQASESNPPVSWWDRRYRDWFGSIAFTAIFPLENCSAQVRKCSELLEQLALRCERDHAGNLFAPGLALAPMLSELMNEPISKRWMTAFQDATGMKATISHQKRISVH